MTTATEPSLPAATPYRRASHFLATLAACAVFPLVFVGAGVTSKDAGMAYPDGFVSNGHLVTNPPGWWASDDTRWEHGHRLLGRVAGVLAIVLAIACWGRSRTLRIASVATLLMIMAQGLLGALRVNEVSTLLAMLHGIFGQLCFCMVCVTAMLTSRSWLAVTTPGESKAASFSRRLAVGVACFVFVQLVLGAALRHFGFELALAAHVLWAIVVAFAIGWLVLWFMAHYPGQLLLVRLSQIMAVLLAVQLVLGGFAYLATYMSHHTSALTRWAVPSLHVAVGALLLACAVLLAMCSHRMIAPLSSQRSGDAADGGMVDGGTVGDDVADGRLVST